MSNGCFIVAVVLIISLIGVSQGSDTYSVKFIVPEQTAQSGGGGGVEAKAQAHFLQNS